MAAPPRPAPWVSASGARSIVESVRAPNAVASPRVERAFRSEVMDIAIQSDLQKKHCRPPVPSLDLCQFDPLSIQAIALGRAQYCLVPPAPALGRFRNPTGRWRVISARLPALERVLLYFGSPRVFPEAFRGGPQSPASCGLSCSRLSWRSIAPECSGTRSWLGSRQAWGLTRPRRSWVRFPGARWR
jgi:hypothetical protein